MVIEKTSWASASSANRRAVKPGGTDTSSAESVSAAGTPESGRENPARTMKRSGRTNFRPEAAYKPLNIARSVSSLRNAVDSPAMLYSSTTTHPLGAKPLVDIVSLLIPKGQFRTTIALPAGSLNLKQFENSCPTKNNVPELSRFCMKTRCSSLPEPSRR